MRDPGRVAVVAVDVQHDFCHPDGAMARLGADVSANERLVTALPPALAAWRARDVPVLAVRQVSSVDTTSPARRARCVALGRAVDAVCGEGTWGAELHADAGFTESDREVVKHRYSAFVDTTLPVLLRSVGVDTVVVVGTAVNVCVDATVRDAYMRDLHVLIARDLVGWTDESLATPALRNLGRHFADLDTAAGITAMLDEGRLVAATP